MVSAVVDMLVATSSRSVVGVTSSMVLVDILLEVVDSAGNVDNDVFSKVVDDAE